MVRMTKAKTFAAGVVLVASCCGEEVMCGRWRQRVCTVQTDASKTSMQMSCVAGSGTNENWTPPLPSGRSRAIETGVNTARGVASVALGARRAGSQAAPGGRQRQVEGSRRGRRGDNRGQVASRGWPHGHGAPWTNASSRKKRRRVSQPLVAPHSAIRGAWSEELRPDAAGGVRDGWAEA